MRDAVVPVVHLVEEDRAAFVAGAQAPVVEVEAPSGATSDIMFERNTPKLL